MSRYLDGFHEDTIIKVLRAYLVNGDSHRTIQKNILRLPAPANGGGFVAMDILHHFDIRGEQKGVLGRDTNYIAQSGLLQKAILKIEELNQLEELANDAIFNKNQAKFESITVTEVERKTMQRVAQSQLRKVVKINYSNLCALCDIHQDELLVCSHIKPWRIDIENRLNPSNAILLCSLHDKLFDRGFFSLDSEYKLIYAQKSDRVVIDLLKDCTFRFPSRDLPDKEFLKYHSEKISEII